MCCRSDQTNYSRRTSQRMRLKMLRNLDQYKIANPLRSTPHLLPPELQTRITQPHYLSHTIIRLLTLPPPNHHETQLTHMALALQDQASRLQAYLGDLGDSVLDQWQLDHDLDCHPTDPSQPEHKNEIMLPLYEDHSQLHQDNLFESAMHQQSQALLELPQPIEHEDYLQFFLS